MINSSSHTRSTHTNFAAAVKVPAGADEENQKTSSLRASHPREAIQNDLLK